MFLSLSLSPDPTLTVEAVAAALQTVNLSGDWKDLADYLAVPYSIRDSVTHSTAEEQNKELAKYFISLHPAPSWSTLAGALYYSEEEAAIQAVSSHLQREDGTLA